MKLLINSFITLSSIYFVTLIHKATGDYFIKPYISNEYVEFDSWTWVHLISTTSLALYYPYELSIENYLYFVLGWEFTENHFLPLLSSYFNFCKESPENIRGDLLASLPGLVILMINKYKNKT